MVMIEFRPYLDYLDSLIAEVANRSNYSAYAAHIDDVLDGQPARELRRFVPLDDLRAAGAFFTGSRLSKFALKTLLATLDSQSVILDPACGTGDLLIACATRLPKGNDLLSTLQSWGSQIIGRDLYPEFIHAAKARLTLAAIREGTSLGAHPLPQIQKTFASIKKLSGLTDYSAIEAATHIVLNPPYMMIEAPEDCAWASGKVNAAALFLEACVLHAQVGTRIAAILPDVLRSGSRYRKWRELIESRTRQHRIELYGQFNQWADVDVFILELEIQKEAESASKGRWKQQTGSSKERVGDRFNVSVGPVVDYRDPHRGPKYPFIKPRDLPAWKTVRSIAHHRRYRGRVLSSPFVVVRRTSRQGDRHRAIGTIINFVRPVAVENHLLVLLPKDGTLETCQELLSILERPETTEWLDQRICCRHLTVSSLEEIPWWTDDGK
jgi:methylase of polypeptide subunit release factors